MRRHALPILGLLLLAASGSPAQQGGDKKPQPKKGTNDVEVRFTDGSTVRMLMLQESIEIDTKYGKLKVPASEIRAIDLGVHLPPGVDKRIEDALGKLNSANFKERDAAVNELVELGVHSYAALVAAEKTTDLEASQRIKVALKRVRENIPIDLLRGGANDRLITSDFPISGRITTATFKAKSPVFGELDLKLSELRSISWVGANSNNEFVVEAAKYALAGQWLDTNITLDGINGLTITATGDIDLLSDGSGQGASTPSGTRNLGIRGGGKASPLPGTLVGRIGETGSEFVIGDRYQALTAPAGKLYLRIIPAPFNNGQPPSGSYRVVIRAGFFLDAR